MTSVCEKNQHNHSQPDPHMGLLAPGSQPGHSGRPAGRAQGDISARACSEKSNEAVFPFLKGALSLPSSTPHRKPEL